MSGPQHSSRSVWVMLMGVSAVLPATSFLFADLPRSWMALCGVAMFVGLLSSRWALPATIAVIGHTTYLAASASAWSIWTVGFAVIALLAVAQIQPSHRRRILLLIVAVLVPLVVVAGVLSRSTWPAEAVRALNVIGGVSLAGVAALAVMWLNAHSPEGRLARRRWVCLSVSALAFVGALRAQEPVTQHALPGWRSRLPTLSPPDAQESGAAQRRLLLTQLAALRAAGLKEADAAWVAVAVLENADPKAIRKICFRGLRTAQLGAAWRQHVEAGRIACQAVRDRPEQGAEYLASVLADSQSELTPRWSAALLRLRGDLFVEMQEGSQALELYARASATGDPYALRNSARLAIDTALAVGPELSTSSDPLVRMWLHPDEEEPEFWAAWNESLDLSALQPLRRVGVRTSGTRDTVKVAHDPDRSYRAVTSKTAPHSAFRAELPPPPGRHPPGEVHLEFRNEYGFRLTYVFEDGRSVAFACVPQAANPQQILRVIPPAQCARVWSKIVVRPAEHLQGRIVSSSLEGIFDLEEIRIVPAQ